MSGGQLLNLTGSTWCIPMRAAENSLLLHVDLRPDPDREERVFTLLDDEEQSRWHRFVVKDARRQFALCRAALRISLCEWLNCSNQDLSFGYLEHGKPFARVNGLHADIKFNVSHSGQHGLIGLEKKKELGVDLEVRVPGRDFDGIGNTVFGLQELRILAAVTGQEKTDLFYRLWSLKEALIKALGSGFTIPPTGFEVPRQILEGMKSAEFRFPHEPSVPYWLEDLGEPRFAAARAWRLTADKARSSEEMRSI